MTKAGSEVVLAHGAGGGFDELFLMAGIGLGFFGIATLTNKKRSRRGRLLGIPVVLLGLFAIASPFVFQFGAPQQASARIASPATVEIVQPAAGAVVRGEFLELRLEVEGARLVDTESSNLRPDRGHLHLSIDGRQYQMTIRQSQRIDVGDLEPGQHLLQIELAATDHGSFKPPVRAVASFTLEK